MRLIYTLVFLFSLLLTGAAIHRWGAAELRADFTEAAFLTAVGFGWLLIATKLFALFGFSLRDDAVERKNKPALVALCAALFGVALTYIGGNLGEGPSYWNNFYSAGLATGGLFGLWLALELTAKVSISVVEERDMASAVRLCGLFLAMGLILARAVAGNWHSSEETFHDFIHDGWPAGLLCVLAIPIEWITRPNRRRPFPSWTTAGLLPAGAYMLLALGWLWHLGKWEGMV
jgi:hypothetical protein